MSRSPVVNIYSVHLVSAWEKTPPRRLNPKNEDAIIVERARACPKCYWVNPDDNPPLWQGRRYNHDEVGRTPQEAVRREYQSLEREIQRAHDEIAAQHRRIQELRDKQARVQKLGPQNEPLTWEQYLGLTEEIRGH